MLPLAWHNALRDCERLATYKLQFAHHLQRQTLPVFASPDIPGWQLLFGLAQLSIGKYDTGEGDRSINRTKQNWTDETSQ